MARSDSTDHQSIPIDRFLGLYDRGDASTAPLTHFTDCSNLRYIDDGSFAVRYGLGINQNVPFPVTSVKRIYNFPTQTANTLLVLSVVGNVGYVYHIVSSTIIYGPILTVNNMTDMAFQPYAGRAFISPFNSTQILDLSIEKGLPGESVYIYNGDGTPARKTGGNAPGQPGQLIIANGIAGHMEGGFRLFGVVAQTSSGFLTPIGSITGFTTTAGLTVSISNIPQGLITGFTPGSIIPADLIQFSEEYEDELNPQLNQPAFNIFNEEYEEDNIMSTGVVVTSGAFTSIGDPNIVNRQIVATKVIQNYDGNPTHYQFFFVPNGVIPNNTDTFINNLGFFDADLLRDASYLFNEFSTLPAGAVLTTYHNRLLVAATYTDISVAWLSNVGDPETVDQINNIIIFPLDGNPITNAWELRDVLYITKRSRTMAWQDNGGNPSSWLPSVIDNALGTCVHGVGTVLDSGSANVDALIIATYQGLTLFNGKYDVPELSWKIENRWRGLNRFLFRNIQIVNAAVQKEIWIVLPDGTMLVGNYSLGMDYKNMRWSPVQFPMPVNSVAIRDIDQIIIGA